MTKNQAVFDRAWRYLLAAWLVALASTASAVFIGEVMGQAPCVLCWYQRIAMFPLVLLLGIALLRSETGVAIYGIALSALGQAVALYHTLLYWHWIPESLAPCGQGPSCRQQVLNLFGYLDLPMLSLIAFTLITVLLVMSMKASGHE